MFRPRAREIDKQRGAFSFILLPWRGLTGVHVSVWLLTIQQINDFDTIVAECARCLRPGGVLIVIDGEPPLLGEDKMLFTPANPDGVYPETKGWFARILFGASLCVFMSSSTSLSLGVISVHSHTHTYTEAARAIQMRGGRVFSNVTSAITRALANAGSLEAQAVYTMYIPLGPWPTGASDAETRWIREIGDMMRRNALEFVVALIPMLKSQGFADDMIQKLIENAQKGECCVG
jgi:hypothetical protein